MRNSYDLKATFGQKYLAIQKYDFIEIDNPDRKHPARLCYLARLNTIVSIVQEMFPEPKGIRVGDFACAQGNIALTLAEKGYKVLAIDINPLFIEYARKKYERGDIEWTVGNIDNLDIPFESLDMIIAGELIEHCAYPEMIVQKMLRLLRAGGLLLLTTPNGSFTVRNQLPSFGKVKKDDCRKNLAEKQYGPGGDEHLFLFKAGEMALIVPGGAEILRKGYTGGSGLLMKRLTQPFLKLLSLGMIEKATMYMARIPLLNTVLSANIYCLIRKL